MALDFSQYGGPSEEWLAVEKTLPARTYDVTMDPHVLREAVNAERESRAAEVMPLLAPHVQVKDYIIPTRDGSTIEARSYRSVKTRQKSFPCTSTSTAEASYLVMSFRM